MIRIAYLGPPPKDLQLAAWPEPVTLFEYQLTIPLFEVDAVIEFCEAATDQHIENEYFLRAGRPIVAVPSHAAYRDFAGLLAAIKSLPRTNYQPINCSFYDFFEEAIVRRLTVALTFIGPDGGEQSRQTRLTDLKTHRTEEFVQLEDQSWLRLDQVKVVNGEAAGASCRF